MWAKMTCFKQWNVNPSEMKTVSGIIQRRDVACLTDVNTGLYVQGVHIYITYDYLCSYLHYLNVTGMCLVMSISARAAVYGLPQRIYSNIISSCIYIIVLFITHPSMHCNASSILCMICHCDINISLIFMNIEYWVHLLLKLLFVQIHIKWLHSHCFARTMDDYQ